MNLNLAKNLNPPLDIVTQRLGCMGKSGSGKTYLAGLIAEQMLDRHAQVIVIDPVGNWYGLRVAPDGKGRGKDIFIIGGDHGDVPILPDAGSRIAHLLVEKRISAILDISSFRQGERKKFATDFAEEFFHLKKKQKSAVHIFVEESQLFAPQRCGPDEARMLGAFEQLIRLGRNYGIGSTLISQRPQSVNKEVLNQIECLFVLQVNGRQERKALEEWVQEAGADRSLVGELPGLEQGEGYVWSPSWLRIYARFRFGKKTTFDSSATPKVGQVVKAATLTPVDIEALREDLKHVIEKVEADDPAVLRRKIVELQKQLGKPVQQIDIAKTGMVQSYKLRIAELEKQLKQTDVLFGKIDTMARGIIETAESIRIATGNMKVLIGKQPVPIMPKLKPVAEWPKPDDGGHALTNLRPVKPHTVDDKLTGPERRILDAMARLRSAGIYPCPRVQVALLANYSNQASTGFAKGISQLSSDALIRYPSAGYVEFTEEGERHVSLDESPVTNEELHRRIFELMPGPERRILTPLIDAYPKAISRQDAAEKSGYGNVASTGFAKGISRLSSLGLIEYPQSGMVRANDLLFPVS